MLSLGRSALVDLANRLRRGAATNVDGRIDFGDAVVLIDVWVILTQPLVVHGTISLLERKGLKLRQIDFELIMVPTTLVILVEADRTLLERELRAFSRSDCALPVRCQVPVLVGLVVPGSTLNLIVCKLHALIVVGWIRNNFPSA